MVPILHQWLLPSCNVTCELIMIELNHVWIITIVIIIIIDTIITPNDIMIHSSASTHVSGSGRYSSFDEESGTGTLPLNVASRMGHFLETGSGVSGCPVTGLSHNQSSRRESFLYRTESDNFESSPKSVSRHSSIGSGDLWVIFSFLPLFNHHHPLLTLCDPFLSFCVAPTFAWSSFLIIGYNHIFHFWWSLFYVVVSLLSPYFLRDNSFQNISWCHISSLEVIKDQRLQLCNSACYENSCRRDQVCHTLWDNSLFVMGHVRIDRGKTNALISPSNRLILGSRGKVFVSQFPFWSSSIRLYKLLITLMTEILWE